jgi:hypothetical protein
MDRGSMILQVLQLIVRNAIVTTIRTMDGLGAHVVTATQPNLFES